MILERYEKPGRPKTQRSMDRAGRVSNEHANPSRTVGPAAIPGESVQQRCGTTEARAMTVFNRPEEPITLT